MEKLAHSYAMGNTIFQDTGMFSGTIPGKSGMAGRYASSTGARQPWIVPLYNGIQKAWLLWHRRKGIILAFPPLLAYLSYLPAGTEILFQF